MAAKVGVTDCGHPRILAYEEAVRHAGLEPVRLTPGQSESLDGLNGLVLTGGTDVNPKRYGEMAVPETDTPDNHRDELEFCLLGEALALDLPVLAICRGMQLLNVHLHGTLHQHLGSGFHEQRRPDETPRRHRSAHEVDVVPNTLLHQITGALTLGVNSRHHQAVNRIGQGLQISAQSADGIVEAVEFPLRRFVLGVQWHPEDRIEASEADWKLFQRFAREAGGR
jgi:putative glutamine amidotransferase